MIGEPDVTAFTSTNQLQNLLIDGANEGIHDLLEGARYRWALSEDGFTTKAKLTTGSVSVTNGSTTVTSKDGDGTAADNFTAVEAGDWVRIASDLTSYKVASIDTASSPDTLVLEDAYLGTTATAASYVILKDTYSVSISDLDEIISISYGENSAFGGDDELQITNMQNIISLSGGDLHRDSSGRPNYIAEISPDSSDVPRYVLWPSPDEAFLLSAWSTRKFTSNTDFSTNLFGGDAPDIAYDAITHHLRSIACLFDEDKLQAEKWERRYERARMQTIAREMRLHRDDQNMSVETYRRSTLRTHGITGQSQHLFDKV